MTARFSDPFLEWRPVLHAEADCAGVWEVRSYSDTALDGVEREAGLRAYCRTCQASYEVVATAGPRDRHGETAVPWVDGGPYPSREPYTRAPAKVPRKGASPLWAHPSRGDGEHGTQYYVTASHTQPREHEDILGVVANRYTRRGTLKWTAAVSGVHEPQTGRRRYRLLYAARNADRDFPSPAAAAKWIAAHLPEAGGQ